MESLHSGEGQSEIGGIVLNTPDPPVDLPYAEYEDFRATSLLEVNGIACTEDALLAVIGDTQSVFRATAAHAIGSLSIESAIPALERLVAETDDLVRAEAAYALVRMGVVEQTEALKRCLDYPVPAYLSPTIAAGYLAQLGDPEGFHVIVEALSKDNLLTRISAAKQIYFFVPFHGAQGRDGKPMGVFAQFDRSLRDQHTDVQWTALVQLREVNMTETRELLRDYVNRTETAWLRDAAQRILDSAPSD